MIDLIVKGGHVLTPSGLMDTAVAIEDGRIVGLGFEGAFPTANKIIDASGKVVMPGLIDTHAHFREPGFTYKEDFTTGSMAAAAGGVTTFFDMPNVKPPTNSVQRFEEKKKLAKEKSVIDFNHLVGATDNTMEGSGASSRGEALYVKYKPLFEEIPKLANAGVAGFKIFMADGVYPHPSELFVDDDGILLDLFECIVKTGLVVSVHPLDKNIYDNDIRKKSEKGLTDPQSFFDVRARYDGISMTSGVVRLLPLQLVTKVKLNLLHVYTRHSIEYIREAKARGQDITTEANPQHAFLKPSDIARLGPYAITATTEANIEALWQAMNNGIIDIVATDHAPHTKEEVEPGWKNINKIPYGAPEVQDYLELFLTEVNRDRISLERVSKMCSENPAKRFGIFPKKGAIMVGSDADLVLVDMKKETRIKPGYTKCGWTPYDGREVKGVPLMTILRGNVIMEEGQIAVKPGFGEWIPGPTYS
jgi:dihydroorotase